MQTTETTKTLKALKILYISMWVAFFTLLTVKITNSQEIEQIQIEITDTPTEEIIQAPTQNKNAPLSQLKKDQIQINKVLSLMSTSTVDVNTATAIIENQDLNAKLIQRLDRIIYLLEK